MTGSPQLYLSPRRCLLREITEEGKNGTEQIKEIYRTVQDRHVGGRWTEVPDPPVQNAVLEWLFRFQVFC